MKIRVRPGKSLRGSVTVPGDKSLSHRSLILGALAEGTSDIRGFLPAGDTFATLHCIRQLGVQVDQHDKTTLTVHGIGLHGLKQPDVPLNFVNAGTGIRLMIGVMSGQQFPSVLDGSEQLKRRPMGRVTNPLRAMGANIEDNAGRTPLHVYPAHLKGMRHQLTVASAQVKSCLLLAGLYADGPTTVIEPGPARDHTERMLKALGADLSIDGNKVTLTPGKPLQPLDITIPADISSAAFLLAAGAIVPDSDFKIINVNTNPTRTGILEALAEMGMRIDLEDEAETSGEPIATMNVQAQSVRGTHINGDLVVRMIDEFPVLMVVATQAKGDTRVSDAHELRVKETDRIAVMAGELRKMGLTIEEYEDGFCISGKQQLNGAIVDGHDDHRVAMSLTIAGLIAEGETIIEDARCVNDSFPGFVEVLQTLGADVSWVN
ncbi:MAG: 3-phosphoshikimate 1-carboxyvinyltransferase [Chloroflexi bacterium]|nr:3-phosphoshikimate 1-carboxyvinyltransferase [Chloroflexota bacterium]